MDGDCRLHGKVKYLYVKTAGTKLCKECMLSGLYKEELLREAIETYPTLFTKEKVAPNVIIPENLTGNSEIMDAAHAEAIMREEGLRTSKPFVGYHTDGEYTANWIGRVGGFVAGVAWARANKEKV